MTASGPSQPRHLPPHTRTRTQRKQRAPSCLPPLSLPRLGASVFCPYSPGETAQRGHRWRVAAPAASLQPLATRSLFTYKLPFTACGSLRCQEERKGEGGRSSGPAESGRGDGGQGGAALVGLGPPCLISRAAKCETASHPVEASGPVAALGLVHGFA